MSGVIDLRTGAEQVAAELAQYTGPSPLEYLVQRTRRAFGCDAVLILEQTDSLTAVCREADGAGPMLAQASDPGIVAGAIREFEISLYEDYSTVATPDPLFAGWRTRGLAIIPAARVADGGSAALLLWKTIQRFPADFSRQIAPVWALFTALAPQQSTRRELAEARERLAAILETIPDAVVFIDEDGERGWLNQRAADLFRLRAGSVSPHEISVAMRQLRTSATNAAALQQDAATRLRDPRAEISDWMWIFESPRRIFSVATRPTTTGEVSGRLWLFRDVTALAFAQRELRDKEERWQLALEGANEGIWDWNALTGRVFYSTRWKSMLGYREEDIPSDAAYWEGMLHPEDAERVKAELDRHLRRETPFYVAEYRMRAKDGSWRWVLARGKAVWDEEGRPVRMVGAHADVTDQKRVQEMLIEAKRSADEANSTKSEFLARMSHELRTPLNAMLGVSGLLAETPLESKQSEYVRVFRRNAERLLELINDILDLSKVEAGALELENVTFEIRDVLGAVRDLLSELARQKGLSLEVGEALDISGWYAGDPHRLQQVLVNLAGNAIKFTDSGAVRIRAGRNPEDPRPGQLLFEVEDTGIGVPAEALARIFEPFVQADSSITRRYHGTGLGLPIAKRLVELMGGTIGVRSEPGQGSCFHFTVCLEPRAGAEQISAPGLPAVAEEQPVKPARILVADDAEDNRFLVRAYLEGLPFDLDFAEDGAIALRKALSGRYDLILMDVQMPEIDGYEATRNLRAYERSRRKEPVPVIALTAHAGPTEAARAADAGCTGWASKPYTKATLLNAIAKALNSSPATEQAADIPPAVRALLPNYLRGYRERLPRMQAELSSGDFDSLRITGHNLKGTGSSFGRPALTRIGAAIESAAAARQADELRALLGALGQELEIKETSPTKT